MKITKETVYCYGSQWETFVQFDDLLRSSLIPPPPQCRSSSLFGRITKLVLKKSACVWGRGVPIPAASRSHYMVSNYEWLVFKKNLPDY